ncbi:MAG: DUF3990 domain-containing protein [Oscillospiraceae bacterium]|nr:DUF3990 domain-containing protein [Oscillospiraceae bacterium]
MQTLVKSIRRQLHLSQTELAAQLNVTFATVNRWENGHAIPKRQAQEKLCALCRAGSVPVFELTLDKIAAIAAGIPVEDGRILLFHTSRAGIEGEIAPISRAQCDFGSGFYLYTEIEDALKLLCGRAQSRLYIASIDPSRLAAVELSDGTDWAMQVALHRGYLEGMRGEPLYERSQDRLKGCDLVIGSTVNDCMFYVLDSFFLGRVTDTALVSSLSALQPGAQYAAITQRACDAVRLEAEVELSYLERQFIEERACQSCRGGVALADQICKKYRREGLYFDELLAQR